MKVPVFGALVKTAAEIKNLPIEIKQKRINPVKAQQKELRKLLSKAQNTEFGKFYHFNEILASDNTVEEFRRRVPVFDYNKLHNEWWHRNLKGEKNVTWPGRVKYFAVSSGTSEAASKFIPITRELNNKITKASIRQLVSSTRYDFPVDFYDKGVLMIGGSTDLQHNEEFGYWYGDLSGISAQKIPAWFDYFYKPGQAISKIRDWGEKMDVIVKEAHKWDIGIIVGVPSWVQLLIERIVREYNLQSIHDLWPNLKVYVHSGVAFAPYEKNFERLFGGKVTYVESYLASEGYIAYQVDLNRRVMQLLVDNGIYFEFVPFNDDNFDSDGNPAPNPQTLSLSEVEENVDYAILLSTCAGTWRYLIGDTIKFLNTKECEIVITGRTKQFLSTVGEHLSQDNLTRAVEMMADDMGISVPEFTLAGVNSGGVYGHYWYLASNDEFDKESALRKIDENLCVLNDDYVVERQHAIGRLNIEVYPPSVFYEFMEQKIGKWGGATKFPRVMKGARLDMWMEYLGNQK
ncbi:MAG: GH3 auxin-responsive promoter family protein [Bacteroidales bacterium]|nr:GH3 auxin-responsive promoter family protein [Bacteroidales bacterium]